MTQSMYEVDMGLWMGWHHIPPRWRVVCARVLWRDRNGHNANPIFSHSLYLIEP